MENLSDVLQLEEKRKREMLELKIQESGSHQVFSLMEEIKELRDQINDMRESILRKIRSYIHDSVSNTPVSIQKQITIKEGDIYSYNGSRSANVSKILSLDKEYILRKVSDEERREKVNEIFSFMSENKDFLQDGFNYTNHNVEKDGDSYTYEYSTGTIRYSKEDERSTKSLKVPKMPPEKENRAVVLIEHGDEIKSLLKKNKKRLMKIRVIIRNLVLKLSEILNNSERTEVPEFYQVEVRNNE